MTPTSNREPGAAGGRAVRADGGPTGVLVVHGFTGNPQSMRGLAEAFAAAGFTVELPLLPGHGTAVEDMIPTRWEDWSGAAEVAYQELAAPLRQVVVAGLSMGGTLTCWLAARHPEIAGIVCVNPAVEPPASRSWTSSRARSTAGSRPSPPSATTWPTPTRPSWPTTPRPSRPVLSLFEAIADLEPKLGEIRCPVLLMTSPQDHVVPPTNSDLLAARVSGPVERVSLERSYHVATLDYDKAEIEARAVEFARKVTV